MPAVDPASPAAPATPPTAREAAKARRRVDLLAAAARLFAARGFDAVRLEDIGAAVGISGPAIYRHFAGKAAVLTAILDTASQDLLDGGLAAEAQHAPGAETLRALIGFQADFALAQRDVIRVQDRDMSALPDGARTAITRTQRAYIDVRARQLQVVHPREDQATAVFRAQAVLGLLNSTPRSVRRTAADRAARRATLVAMAWAAATAPGPLPGGD